MNPVVKNSLIATSVLATVYIFNLALPQNLSYAIAASTVLILVLGKFVFSIDFKFSSIKENIQFLVMPILFNMGALAYVSFINVSYGRFMVAILAILVNYYMFVALRRVKNLGERASIFYRNVLIAISFVTIFLTTSMLFRIYMIASTSPYMVLFQLALVGLVFTLVYYVSYFLAWENGGGNVKFHSYNLVNALIAAEIAWVSTIWIVNYPVLSISEKATLSGTPLPAITITIIFYFLWGIISHKLDKSLSRKILTEYMLLTIVFLGVLLITAKWLPIS